MRAGRPQNQAVAIAYAKKREAAKKGQPGGSSVHVNAPVGAVRYVQKTLNPNPPLNNLEVELARHALDLDSGVPAYTEDGGHESTEGADGGATTEPATKDDDDNGRRRRGHGGGARGDVEKDAVPRRISTVAVKCGDHMLFGKRRDNGKWTCPGGHCDPDEDHHAGAVRELEEETGIKVHPSKVEELADVVEKSDREGKPLHVQPFKVDLKQKPSTSMLDDPDGEVYRWRWVDVSDGLPDELADNLHVPPEHNVLLQALGLAEPAAERVEMGGPGSGPHPGQGHGPKTTEEHEKAVHEAHEKFETAFAKDDERSTPETRSAMSAAMKERDAAREAYDQHLREKARAAGITNKQPTERPKDRPRPLTGRQAEGLTTIVEAHKPGTANTPNSEKMPSRSTKKSAVDKDGEAFTAPGDDQDDDVTALYDMQQVVSGMDWEMQVGGVPDEETAHEAAEDNLEDDPDYYRKKWAESLSTDNAISEDDALLGDGLCLDLGSGQSRARGHIGVDLYPYDAGTLVHDLTLGLPFPDQCATQIRLTNALDDMDMDDPKPLMSEIQRVLAPGGQFHYEGPDAITNDPGWLDETDYGEVEKAEGDESPAVVRQTFTRIARPDAATADDAEPRVGISQYDMLPADQLLAMDALGYYWSDATSSGRGNRIHGYPSQGALAIAKGFKVVAPTGAGAKANLTTKLVRIAKINPMKQIVYGVVLSPDEFDDEDDIISAQEIEKTAHNFLLNSRVIGGVHEEPIDAALVESYCAPLDFDLDTPYGPQKVKQGAWVIGVLVRDKDEWAKVLAGDYQGFSVGGFGLRDSVA